MPERPAFRPDLRVAAVEDEGVFLLGEHERRVLTGRLSLLVAPLLDGTRTVDEIVAALDGAATERAVRGAIAKLAAAGHLVDAAVPPVAAATVEVVAFGAASELAVDVPGVQIGVGGDVVLALTDDYLRDELAVLNRDGRPWLLAKPVGTVLWVGPFFRPGATACWECLAARLRENRRIERYVDARSGPAVPPAVTSPASAQAGVALAALELLAGERRDTRIWTLDLRSGESAHHVVQRRPQCPVCGVPRGGPSPVELRSGPQRARSAEETLRIVEPHVSPITGAVTSLRRTTLPEQVADLLHHYVAGQPWVEPTSLASLRHGLRSSGVGVASTDAGARVVAICEAIERTSPVLRGDEPVRRASSNELGDAAIEPNDWLLYSERQLAGRKLDPDAQIDWSPVWSLTRGDWRYLPTRLLYYAHPADGYDWLWADSNGTAAGATLEEAVLSGIHELVERDSTALWWSNRVRRPAVDASSFADPYVDAAAARLRQLGREFWVLDLTSDIEIPVFCAVSGPEQILLGFGADADAGAALRHATRELLQHLAGALDPGPAGHRHYDQRQWVDFWATETVETLPYLVPSDDRPRVAADFPLPESHNIARCQALIEARGLELLVHDFTRPEIGFPVAKAIVPGMRAERPRHAPGRLYDVPVELGWLDRARTEDELNPLARPL
jgi:ribosomal protein S12 methylthiotransferase accessory factor